MPALLNSSRARQYMKENNLDALIATSPVNVKYFSGYSCWLEPLFREFMLNPGASSEFSMRSFVVFPREGAPALIVKSNMSPEAADLQIDDLRVYGESGLDYSLPPAPSADTEPRFLSLLRDTPGSTTAIQALTAALRDRGLDSARIGLEMEGLSGEMKAKLHETLPRAEVLDCSNLIRLVRAVKTEKEVRLLAQAAGIAEQAAFESLAEVRVGGRTRDLVHRFQSRVGKCGATYDHFSLSLNGLGISSEPDRTFRSQDVMFIDFGCIVSSYFSDTGTTLAFSPLSPELARRYDAMRSSVEHASKMTRPGIRSSTIQAAMAAVVREAGITHSFPHGHGMGVEIRDYPILVPANGLEIRDECLSVSSDLPLEEGMVINLEAPLFMPTVGALQVEKTFVVTGDGCRELIPQDRSRPYIAS